MNKICEAQLLLQFHLTPHQWHMVLMFLLHWWHTGGTRVAHQSGPSRLHVAGPLTDVPICPVTQSCLSSGRSERKQRFPHSAQHGGEIGVSVQTTRAGAALRTCSAQVTAASKSGFEKSEEPGPPTLVQKKFAKNLFSCVLSCSLSPFRWTCLDVPGSFGHVLSQMCPSVPSLKVV